MSKLVYGISDISGQEGQNRLDHYNKWLMDPKREFGGSVYPGFPASKSKKEKKVVESVVVEPGTFLWFNNKLPHGTENLGDIERITFVIDVPHSQYNP